MKKSKIWIRVCVHLLLFITLGVRSSKFAVNPVTDDISRLSDLRHNIPKDYKIPVRYIPREEGGMCWVKLSVFYLEDSLQDLAHKFGNISSNRKDISIFIQMLQELRLKMGSLERLMYDFDCHYRAERWATAEYFEYVQEFLTAAQQPEESDDCDPAPCPSTPHTETIPSNGTATVGKGHSLCGSSPDCSTYEKSKLFSEVVERSLLSLLFIPLLALVFLLVWKVRSRRNEENLQQNPVEDGLFPGIEGSAPPLDAEISEKNKLNVIETV